MTLAGKNRDRNAPKEKHISRNCASKSIKKHGAGKYNWGTFDDEISEMKNYINMPQKPSQELKIQVI